MDCVLLIGRLPIEPNQIRKRQHNEQESAESYIQNLLQMPENIRIESVVGIGYPAHSREAIPFSELDFSKISER